MLELLVFVILHCMLAKVLKPDVFLVAFTIVLTSINVFSGLLSMSLSASISDGWGSETRFLESTSGALLRFPLTHSAVKLYPMILGATGFLSHQGGGC